MDFEMKEAFALMMLAIAVSTPAAARCCSLGGSGSYDFLGDSDMSVNMDSYDEFLRDNVAQSTVSVGTTSGAIIAQASIMSLNLSGIGRIDLRLSENETQIEGAGNLTQANETSTIEAAGRLMNNTINLNVTDSRGNAYSFGLVAEGSTVLGDYSLTKPNGSKTNGTAEGTWAA